VEKLAASFRDPSGFVFRREGVLYRQINPCCAADYGQLMDSGLYAELTHCELLVEHEEVDAPPVEPSRAFKIIRPREIPFISYPYEWCFSQLQDAARLTLEIQDAALAHGMTLKDANAFNIQFRDGKPIHIDTLSFTTAKAGPAWTAYGQFCRHFLAPLALMSFRDARLGRLLALHPDGVPLDLAGRILPRRAFWNFHRWVHLWLHQLGEQNAHRVKTPTKSATAQQRLALVDSLRSAVKSLPAPRISSRWSQYETTMPSYSADARSAKERTVEDAIALVHPKTVWDLGCNTGVFSDLAARHGATVIASDYDHDCIEAIYRRMRSASSSASVLPLVIDFANPTPPVGWAGAERFSWLQRGPADLVLALAIVHHWALGGNVPLPMIAEFLAASGRRVLVEFVPKTDPMSQQLLATRPDIFPDYDRANFENAFLGYFDLRQAVPLPESERVLFLFERRNRDAAHSS
jgi:hypothetical protein